MPPRNFNRPSGPRRRGMSIQDYFNPTRTRTRRNPRPEEVIRNLVTNQPTNLPADRVYNVETGRTVLRRNVLTRTDRLRRRYMDREIRNNILLPDSNIRQRIFGIVTYDFEYFRTGEILLNQQQFISLPFTANLEEQVATRLYHKHVINVNDSDGQAINIRYPRLDTTFRYPNRNQTISLRNVRVRKTKALLIDGLEKQEWDLNDDMCVINFLRYYYGDNIKLSKKIFQENFFDAFFNEGYKEEGVSPVEIKNFCMNYEINMLALDPGKNVIESYKSNHIKSKFKALVFIIENDHLHPILDVTEKRKLLSKHNNVLRNAKIGKKDLEIKEKKYTVEIIETLPDKPHIEQMIDIIHKIGVSPISKNIKMAPDGKSIEYFILQDKKYIFRNKKNNDLINAYGEDYDGETSSSIVNKSLLQNPLPSSKFLPEVLDNILGENTKNKTHKGIYEFYDCDTLEEMLNLKGLSNDDVITFDINKCHTDALIHPKSDWILFDYSCEIEEYVLDDEKVKPGLYFIETEDRKLFSGNKWYSNAIVEKGIKCGYINFDDIKYQLLSSKQLPKHHFHTYYSDFIERSNGNINVLKSLMNSLSGILGRSHRKITDTHISTSCDDVGNYFYKQAHKHDDFGLDGSFCYQYDVNEEDRYFFYSYHKEYKLQENNVAIYHQILDHQAMLLHDYVEFFTEGDWSKLLYRNIDCFTVIKNNDMDYEEYVSKEIGDVKLQENPNNLYHIPYRDSQVKIKENKDYTTLTHIKTSNDYMLYKELVDKGISALTPCFGGAGKGYVIKNLQKSLRTLNLTVTNVSARNIGGSTIHSKFKYNDTDGNVNRKLVEELIDQYDFMILDEVELFTSNHLNAMLEVKKILNIPVLAFGDYKQLQNFDGKSLEFHPITKDLCDHNRIELQWHENCRLDKEMMNILQPLRDEKGDIDEVVNKFKHSVNRKELTRFNMCYTNEKRIRVNKIVSDLYDTKSKWLLDKRIQDIGVEWDGIRLHENMPIMRITNDHDKNMFNGERYNIKSYDNQFIYITRNDVDYKEKFLDFFENYVAAYCMTNHKIIGITCNEPVSIHETNHKGLWGYHGWFYTVFSRAKTKDQITIFDI